MLYQSLNLIRLKKIITDIDSPYHAGQFLYGVNGVSEIEVNLDNGKHVFFNSL